MEAMVKDKADLVRALLKEHALTDQADEQGYTALMVACQEGRLDYMCTLLEAGAPVAQALPDGFTALSLACVQGHLDCVRALLEAGAPVAQATQHGISALMGACTEGHLDCVRALLEASAPVAQAAQDGSAALKIACREGHLDCVRVLLEAGASVRRMDNGGGVSLLTLARPDLPLLQLLCAHGARRNELIEWELSKMPEECRAWILATWRWSSELHHLELLPPARVRELLVGGADPHACDGGVDAPTPLLLARALLHRDSEHEGAQLDVRAAAPWSPMVNHSLSPARVRARAVKLFVLGYLLARERPELVIAEQAFIDVWVEHVMPCTLAREGR
jgi:hypothetical protein